MSRLKEIEGYNGDYLITDDGEVISNKICNYHNVLKKELTKVDITM